jgi:phosphoglycolate phosphatase
LSDPARSCLIFDLDGTLVDSLPGIAASLNRALAGKGLGAHSLQTVRGFIGNGTRVLARRAAGEDASEELVGELEQCFKADYDLTWPEGSTAYPGIRELLEELRRRNFPLAVLSNKPHPFTVAMVGRIFPDVAFAAILGQRPDVPHKPDPAGVHEILGLLKTDAAASILIGDSTMDLETARRAGMRAIACGWGYHDADRLRVSGADRVAADVATLQGWLREAVLAPEKIG